jgi:hypothetical protein
MWRSGLEEEGVAFKLRSVWRGQLMGLLSTASSERVRILTVP